MDLQGGPTFEDLSIDDELTQLQRLVRYSSSSIALQRLVHVKMLSETVAAVGFEQTVKSVVPLLAPLAEDQELVVRQHLGEQLEEIARFCRLQGKEAGYRLIIEIVLPTLAKLLGDQQAEVRQAAGESLVGVANLMKPIDLGHHVLTIVLQLAHDDEQEELRMTAAALLNDLAEALGYDLCKQFVTPEMESLSEDPVFRVRKATALNLDKIIKVVGEAGVSRLLPAYVRLTKDDVYRVRKACTEAMVEMSKAVGAEVSLKELTPVFLNLASDSSKLVRTGALQHLGRLISTLPGDSVSEDLVRYFTGTAAESMGDPVAEAELRLYCAFSFPAVVITIGPERWHELRESFATLIRDPSWSVRKTLSFSLHEIAKVLKADDVERDLVPAMESFLRDMEDVRLGVIRQLGDFFREMNPQQREKHLHVLVEILQTTSPFNWRLREVLAQQLPRLAPLLSPDSVFFAVVPVAFGLLNDPVAVVREKTFEVVAPLLQLAGAHSGARQASMVSRVRELAHAHTYQARQMYVYICHSMACSLNSSNERPLFVQEFVPSLAELATDSVVNVRIAMSRALSKCPDWVMELPDIRRAIHHLVKDINPDVRHFVSFLPPILPNDLVQEEKQHPGQETSSVLSDESVLTQWSVSTQRSMLSVGDFPPVRDGNSPNSTKSIKLGRQRSSSVESVGDTGGYSTTSEEGEGLKRLTSRRPPLPAGWGQTAVSSAEPEPTAADGDNSTVASAAAAPTAAETKPEGVGAAGGADGGSPPTVDVGWGSAAAAVAAGGQDGQEGGAVVSSEADALMFGLQAAAVGTAEARDEGRDDDPPVILPPAPKRAASQDAAVTEEDDDDGGAGVVEEKRGGVDMDGDGDGDGDGGAASTAALNAKITDLTLSADAAGLAGATSDGMMPPTPLPLPDNRGVEAPLNIVAPTPTGLRKGPPSGFGGPGEPHSPSGWGGRGGGLGVDVDVDESASPSGVGVGGAPDRAHPAAAVVGDYPQQRGGLNLTPPPWEGSERRDLAAAAGAVPSLPARVGGSSLPVEVESATSTSSLFPDEATPSAELAPGLGPGSEEHSAGSVVADRGQEEKDAAAGSAAHSEKLPLEDAAAAADGVKLAVGGESKAGEGEKAAAPSPSGRSDGVGHTGAGDDGNVRTPAAEAVAGPSTAAVATASEPTVEPAAATPAGGGPPEEQGQGRRQDSILKVAGEAVVTAAAGAAAGVDDSGVGRKPGVKPSAPPALAGGSEGKSGRVGAREGEGSGEVGGVGCGTEATRFRCP
eukprot:g13217.t1